MAGRAGFTMIELLLVMAILGTLVATFALSTASARENAKVVKATAESRALANSIRLFCLAMTDTAISDDGGNPLSVLGLSDGLRDADSTLTNMLTKPSASNGNTVYFEANDRSIRANRLCDPWGNPYKIRVKRVNLSVKQEEDYEIIVPVPGRHRALEPLN
ncbi:MAG: prepilin-type N-terminal cleavage/methylation domain-containing protein [Kiritimatiellae bacterium]|nr:prepilin-type N-terminal cleavage/methylation domain-containing protein [Kiritimatiellia bacterium]